MKNILSISTHHHSSSAFWWMTFGYIVHGPGRCVLHAKICIYKMKNLRLPFGMWLRRELWRQNPNQVPRVLGIEVSSWAQRHKIFLRLIWLMWCAVPANTNANIYLYYYIVTIKNDSAFFNQLNFFFNLQLEVDYTILCNMNTLMWLFLFLKVPLSEPKHLRLCINITLT